MTRTVNGLNLSLDILIKALLFETPPQPPPHGNDYSQGHSKRPKYPKQLRHDHAAVLSLPIEKVRAEDRGYEGPREKQRG